MHNTNKAASYAQQIKLKLRLKNAIRVQSLICPILTTHVIMTQASNSCAPQTEKACAIIVCDLGDVPLRLVMNVDYDSGHSLQLFDA